MACFTLLCLRQSAKVAKSVENIEVLKLSGCFPFVIGLPVYCGYSDKCVCVCYLIASSTVSVLD